MENPTPSGPTLSRPPIRAAIGLGLLLMMLDLTAKAIAIAKLPPDKLVPTAIPFFSWRLAYNTGSHYLFGPVGEWIPYRLLMAIAAVAVIGVIALLAKEVRQASPPPLFMTYWLLIAVLTGALANSVEVVARGRATDFFMIHPFPWPANLCDQYVNAILFVLLPLSLWLQWRMPQSAEE
ncbi:MAG: hypothetical protein GQ526_05290 [Ardenticatenales bacterium]|nr:hypothetical protein [Ardenticatenales bacterium]